VEEATEEITRHLKTMLRQPGVSVRLIRLADTQQISGFYQVQPDGTINLRRYGEVYVTGKTIAEARSLIEKQLAAYFASPRVGVDVGQYNSKKYFVITCGAGQGEQIAAFSITGNETVLDAICRVQGLSQLSSKTMWVARAAPSRVGGEQVLPVDWDAITRGALTATNYQLLPGDRVYIAGDDVLALNSFIWKVTTPLERLLGITGFGTETARGAQTLGRAYNAQDSE
jgi:protein involved in polysaccharide export with SLBB domain